MTTTKTVTREYDAEGRLVKEVETTVTTPDAPTYVPIQKYVAYNGTYSTGVN